ncbi:MAG: hypothetical protein JXR36_16325 [Bacteroidales bacterium]|nr:hypothetical protein [Bacteroidales bacterium]
MIILHADGQTCNKLFTYLNYAADSMDSGEIIVVLSPDITTRDYPNLLNSGIIRYPFYSKLLAYLIGYRTYINLLQLIMGNKYIIRIFQIFFRWIPSISFIKAPTGSHKSDNTQKYANELKTLFTPNLEITREVEVYFQSVRKVSEIICGVHIRYGDYKTWQGGKYYYSIKQYHSVMLKVKELFSTQLISFFISSNEHIDLLQFTDCNCFILPDSTSTKDLYGLSISDYIIGPPSTFSGWASFHGNTPLHFIEKPDAKINLASFKYISEIWC